jgi:hypothetical protein
MKDSELECLKTPQGQLLEIETAKGEQLLIRVISVFDEESDPDVFFYDVTSGPDQQDPERSQGYRLSLQEIVSVKRHEQGGGR